MSILSRRHGCVGEGHWAVSGSAKSGPRDSAGLPMQERRDGWRMAPAWEEWRWGNRSPPSWVGRFCVPAGRDGPVGLIGADEGSSAMGAVPRRLLVVVPLLMTMLLVAPASR